MKPPHRRQFLSLGASLAGLALAAWPARLVAQTSSFRWSSAASMPAAVQEIYPALFEGRIHVAGGLAAGRLGSVSATDAVHVYDPKTDAWSAGPRLDKRRHHPNLIAAQGSLWSFGGFHTSSAGAWTCNGDVLRLDAGAQVWEPATPMPRPRGETVVGVLDGRVHVVAGRAPKASANGRWRDHADVADHDVFDPATGTWESLRPAPVARNSHAGVVLGGKLYAVGGRTVSGGNRAELEAYDPKTDRWDRLAPLPQAQGGLAAAALEDKLVAMGGEFFNARGGGVYPEVWVYDPARDAWSAGPAMPTPRHGLGAVALENRVFVIGGATEAGGNGTSATVEVLSA